MAKVTGKTKKTETFTTRFEPKDRYTLELLARLSKRSIAKTLEEAISEQARKTLVATPARPELEESLADMIHALWSPMAWERLINLAGLAPQLLTYAEECKLVLMTRSLAICAGVERNEFGGISEVNINVRMAELAWPLIEELGEKMANGEPAPPPTLSEIVEHHGSPIDTSERDVALYHFSVSMSGPLRIRVIPALVDDENSDENA